jgi:hypothetical protein
VRAYDDEGESSYHQVTITVDDVNEAPIDLDLWGVEIGENLIGAPGGTYIGVFDPNDPDLDRVENFKYYLDSDPSGKFVVSEITGQLTLKEGETLNYEEQSEYTIRVRVTDRGEEAFEKDFTIYVQDRNDAPTGIIVAGRITENQDPGEFFASLYYDGEDTGQGANVFSIENDPTGFFFIDPLNPTRLRLKPDAAIDYESLPPNLDNPTGPRYLKVTLTLAHTYGGTTTYLTKEVSVPVYNANESPAITAIEASGGGEAGAGDHDGKILVSPDEQPGEIGIVRAGDPDGTDTLSYALDGNHGGLFGIDEATGVIRIVDADLLGDNGTTYDLVVVVSDGKGGVSRQTATVLVDPNTEPVLAVTAGQEETFSALGQPAFAFRGITLTDADNDDLTLTISFDAARGTFSRTNVADVTVQEDGDVTDGVYTLTLKGKAGVLQTFLANLSFTAAAAGGTEFDFTLADAKHQASLHDNAILVTVEANPGVNDAPTFQVEGQNEFLTANGMVRPCSCPACS